MARSLAHKLAWLGVFALGVGASCLTSLGPDIRARDHHAGLDHRTASADCMSCHEPEIAALERLTQMSAEERASAEAAMAAGDGATLVAQWMIDDARSCVQCHEPRSVAP